MTLYTLISLIGLYVEPKKFMEFRCFIMVYFVPISGEPANIYVPLESLVAIVILFDLWNKSACEPLNPSH